MQSSQTMAGVGALGACAGLVAALSLSKSRSRTSPVTRNFFGDDSASGREPTSSDVGSKVYFDVQIGGKDAGRVVFGLFDNVVPKTAANFKAMCTASKSPEMTYEGCPFHRIIPGFMIQGGDYERMNGTGGRSIYGNKFEDENFDLAHTRPYLLSMANAGPNSNGSQFFITTSVTNWLDGKHVVFGEVLEGKDVIDAMESTGSQTGRTSTTVVISDCGEM
mmetsp:Transcript_13210/g.19319  ORF Transcript_13210/g.19319 Transcript_13210/m.19319 type:complete len:220 (-) Transcript_13210:115-774(-)